MHVKSYTVYNDDFIQFMFNYNPSTVCSITSSLGNKYQFIQRSSLILRFSLYLVQTLAIGLAIFSSFWGVIDQLYLHSVIISLPLKSGCGEVV